MLVLTLNGVFIISQLVNLGIGAWIVIVSVCVICVCIVSRLCVCVVDGVCVCYLIMRATTLHTP